MYILKTNIFLSTEYIYFFLLKKTKGENGRNGGKFNGR